MDCCETKLLIRWKSSWIEPTWTTVLTANFDYSKRCSVEFPPRSRGNMSYYSCTLRTGVIKPTYSNLGFTNEELYYLGCTSPSRRICLRSAIVSRRCNLPLHPKEERNIQYVDVVASTTLAWNNIGRIPLFCHPLRWQLPNHKRDLCY